MEMSRNVDVVVNQQLQPCEEIGKLSDYCMCTPLLNKLAFPYYEYVQCTVHSVSLCMTVSESCDERLTDES